MAPKATTGRAIAIRRALAVLQDLAHGSWPERKNDRPGGESLAQRAASSSKAWVDLSETEQVDIILTIPVWKFPGSCAMISAGLLCRTWAKRSTRCMGGRLLEARAAQFPIKMP